MNGSERHKLIEDTVLEALESKRQAEAEADEAETAQRKGASQGRTWLLFLVSVSVLVWIWTARPSIIFGPDGTGEALGPEQVEAKARYAIFLEEARVELFAAEHGRLPGLLSEAGPVEASVRYLPNGDSYSLEVSEGALELSFVRGMSVDSFLGNSLQVLRETD